MNNSEIINLIIESCVLEHIEVLKDLINNIKDINIQDDEGNTIFNKIIKKYENENIRIKGKILNFIINIDNININIKDNDENTPLMNACNYMMFKNKNQNQNQNQNQNEYVYQPKNEEEYFDLIDICALIINNKDKLNIDLNIKDNGENTVLMNTCRYNNIIICKLLINNGADINLINNLGKNALMIASVYNNQIIGKLLIKNGADINMKDNYNYNALHIAIEFSSITMIKLLIANKIDMNAINNDNETPLSIACLRNKIDICKLLIENGADVNIQYNDGSTELMRVYLNNKIDINIMKLLLDNNANIHLMNNNGISVLMMIYSSDAKNNKLTPKDNLLLEKSQIINDINSLYEILIKENILTNSINSINDYIIIFLHIKGMIYNKKKTLNIEKSITFFYNLREKYMKNIYQYYNLEKYNIEKNKELETIIKNLKNYKKTAESVFQIGYKNENGINASGLSRHFFDNLETKMNEIYTIPIELKKIKADLAKTQTIIKLQASKLIIIKKSNKNLNKMLNLEKSISDLNLSLIEKEKTINKLNDKYEIAMNYNKSYNEIDHIHILAISKKNCNPIFYMNIDLKKKILNAICTYFNKKLEKNYIYNILNYISGEEHNNKSKIKDFLFTSNNMKSIMDIFYKKENNLKEVKNSTSNKKLSLNNIKDKYLNNIESKSNNNPKNKLKEEQNENIISNINELIKLNIYENIYDFYLSHFAQKKIEMDTFLKNLKFEYVIEDKNNINIKNSNELNIYKENMENLFINMFKTFTDEELFIFNKTISGRTYKIAEEYIINIYINSKNGVPCIFHTCSFKVDIFDKMFKKFFYNKNNNEFNKDPFVTLMKNIYLNFTIA